MAQIYARVYELTNPDVKAAKIPDADLSYVEVVQVEWRRETVEVTYLLDNRPTGIALL